MRTSTSNRHRLDLVIRPRHWAATRGGLLPPCRRHTRRRCLCPSTRPVTASSSVLCDTSVLSTRTVGCTARCGPMPREGSLLIWAGRPARPRQPVPLAARVYSVMLFIAPACGCECELLRLSGCERPDDMLADLWADLTWPGLAVSLSF